MKVEILAKPGSSKPGLERDAADRVVVRVRAKPDKGKANEEIAEVVAEYLGIPKSQVKVLTPTSRRKLLDVPAEAWARFLSAGF